MARAFDSLSFVDTIETHPEGVAYVGLELLIEDCNETFRGITGFGNGPLQRLDSLIHPSHFEVWSSGLSRFLSDRSGRRDRETFRLCRRGMPDKWVQFSFVPLEDNSFLVFLSDITKQKQLEMKLISARDTAEEATKSKSEFIANTSHEIRTPIHTVIGMAELLGETEMDQEQAEYLGQIRFAADVLLTLINDILDFSKIEAGQLRLEKTVFKMINMLEEATDLVILEAHKKNIDVSCYVDPWVPTDIKGDPNRLRQVVVNLINNAVKFTHKGHVLLEVETVSLAAATVVLRFSVSDSGIGISTEKQKNLFQAFHQADSSTTRQFGGTGLGLFISRNIVNQMGGTLSFSSELGKGSRFFFEVEFERADDGIALPIIPDNFFAKRRILVVDDNDTIRNRLSRTLKSWGLDVDEACGAKEALSLIHSSKGKPYELVIVDQTMPYIDGWQFASEIHSDTSIDKPLMILMSMKGGHGTLEAKMKLLGWFDIYLTKPIRRQDLAASVFRLLSRTFDIEIAGELEEVEDFTTRNKSLPLTGRRILIAEDHEVNRKLLHVVLKKNGHEVLEAPNGKVAFEIAVNENPDLIFMDCQMPIMNGYESSQKIRETGYANSIIAITASVLAEERNKCIKSGMNDLVTKPFRAVEIIAMINKHMSDPIQVVNLEDTDDEVEAVLPESSYSDLAVFNFDAAVQIFLGNEEIVRKLLEPQISKMEGEMDILRRSIALEDWETVRTTAHSIKGSCRNMAMNRCGQAASELEEAGINADAKAGLEGLASLEREFPMLKSAVEEILGNQ